MFNIEITSGTLFWGEQLEYFLKSISNKNFSFINNHFRCVVFFFFFIRKRLFIFNKKLNLGEIYHVALSLVYIYLLFRYNDILII